MNATCTIGAWSRRTGSCDTIDTAGRSRLRARSRRTPARSKARVISRARSGRKLKKITRVAGLDLRNGLAVLEYHGGHVRTRRLLAVLIGLRSWPRSRVWRPDALAAYHCVVGRCSTRSQALVAVHGVVAAANGGDLADAVLLDLGPASWLHILDAGGTGARRGRP